MPPIIHHPFIFHIGPFPLTGFGLAMVMAFVVGQYVCEAGMRERGLDSTPFGDITLGAVIGCLLGAKIYYAFLTHSLDSLFHREGFVFWGGLAGGIIGTSLVVRSKKLSFRFLSDFAAPGLAAAYAIGRTGCWAVGDDYGRPWNSPFAVAFPQGAPASTVASLRSFGIHVPDNLPLDHVMSVYPTQVIEVALGVVMFAMLWHWRRHRHAEGWLFGAYLALAGVERFLVEFLRAKDDRFLGPFTLAQMFAVVFVVAGLLWMRARSAPSASSTQPSPGPA